MTLLRCKLIELPWPKGGIPDNYSDFKLLKRGKDDYMVVSNGHLTQTLISMYGYSPILLFLGSERGVQEDEPFLLRSDGIPPDLNPKWDLAISRGVIQKMIPIIVQDNVLKVEASNDPFLPEVNIIPNWLLQKYAKSDGTLHEVNIELDDYGQHIVEVIDPDINYAQVVAHLIKEKSTKDELRIAYEEGAYMANTHDEYNIETEFEKWYKQNYNNAKS